MALDVKKWLMEDMGFSAEEAEKMAPSFAGDRATKLEAGYVAGNDRAAIAAARQEVQTLQTNLKAQEDKLNRDILDWAQLSDAEKAKATDLQARLDKAELDVVAARQALTKVAEQAGIDPKTVLPNSEPPKREEPKVNQIDTSKFVDRESHSTLTAYLAEMAATLPFIAQEHFDLTGKRLDTREIYAEIKTRAGKKDAVMDPVKIWEEKYGIPKIREDKAAEARAEEIRQAEARGEERARTNFSIPGADMGSRSHRPSPILHPGHARQSVLSRPKGNDAALRGVAALRTGKYATKAS